MFSSSYKYRNIYFNGTSFYLPTQIKGKYTYFKTVLFIFLWRFAVNCVHWLVAPKQGDPWRSQFPHKNNSKKGPKCNLRVPGLSKSVDGPAFHRVIRWIKIEQGFINYSRSTKIHSIQTFIGKGSKDLLPKNIRTSLFLQIWLQPWPTLFFSFDSVNPPVTFAQRSFSKSCNCLPFCCGACNRTKTPNP